MSFCPSDPCVAIDVRMSSAPGALGEFSQAAWSNWVNALRIATGPMTMANTLKRMERDGLIERLPHPEDRRAQQNWLTERAKALQKPATAAARAQNEAALSDLSDDEREAFLDLTTKIVDTMRRQRTAR